MTFKIFVHCDDDIRLCRRSWINFYILKINWYQIMSFYFKILKVKRDVKERGREVGGILLQYNRFVK